MTTAQSIATGRGTGTVERTAYDQVRAELTSFGLTLKTIRNGTRRYYEVVAPKHRLVFLELADVLRFVSDLRSGGES